MTRFEYKVISAPGKGRKGPGIKGPEARFAHAIEAVLNELAAEGWEYQRSDILPSEERQGLTSSHTVYRSVLVFRRAIADGHPAGTSAETPDSAHPEPAPETPPEPEPVADTSDTAPDGDRPEEEAKTEDGQSRPS